MTEVTQRDVVQEHKDLLTHWHESVDTKHQISAFTSNRRIEIAKQRKEDNLTHKREMIEGSMRKWDEFRVRRQETVDLYIRTKNRVASTFKLRKLL